MIYPLNHKIKNTKMISCLINVNKIHQHYSHQREMKGEKNPRARQEYTQRILND
jgi:hypothetical protein